MARKEPSQEGFDGVLSMSPRGFGFVMAAGRDDVYLPPEAVGGALHGDRGKRDGRRRPAPDADHDDDLEWLR